MTNRTVAAIALTAAGLVGTAHPTLASDIWGLVIGVDDYQHVDKLGGAINDAKDIAQALHKVGAKEVKLLTDVAADRDGIMVAWKDIVTKAKPGDTVFLTYAGHGVKAKGSDGHAHQFVALGGFEFKGEGTYQRIMDEEFGAMLRAVPKLNVVFVVDSCHSGTMTRAYGAKRTFKVRSIASRALEDDRLASKEALPAGEEGNVVLPNVVHLGAVQPNELDPEIFINEKPRGALSFAVARALEGAADANKNGSLQPSEIEEYVRGVIATATDGQQHPRIALRRDWSLPLTREIGGTPPAVAETAATFDTRPVRLAVIGAASANDDAGAKSLQGVTLVTETDGDLIWNVGRGQVLSHLGDVVSYPVEGTRAFQRAAQEGSTADKNQSDELPRIQKIVDKMAVVNAIKEVASRHNVAMDLSPDDKLHHAGQRVALTFSGQKNTNLTLFNLASDGTLNFLYPLSSDPLVIPADKPYRLDLTVEPPFGADHIVAILSSEPLPDLHKALAALDNTAAAAKLGSILAKGLASKTYQIGIHPSFTAPK